MASLSNNIMTFRRHDLDNLRTLLTNLVTLHHTGVSYGGPGSWLFRSSIFSAGLSPPLVVFECVNQSFFMGLFFWISGRMSAQALAKAPSSTDSLIRFIRSKSIRLGLPTVAFSVFVQPACMALARGRFDGKFFLDYWGAMRSAKGVVWYTATLLVFDTVAALLSRQSSKGDDGNAHEPTISIDTYTALKNYGWIAAAAAGFVIRIWYPVGIPATVINIQPAYMSQYILTYTLGFLSFSHGDSRLTGPFDSPQPKTDNQVKADDHDSKEEYHLLDRTTGLSLPTVLAISVLTFPLLVIPAYLNDTRPQTTKDAFGGWNLSALLYAVWGEFSLVVIGPALMSYFQQHQDKPTKSRLWNPRYSYAAFLLHSPISVAVGLAVDKAMAGALSSAGSISDSPVWRMVGPVLMTAAVGTINCAMSFAVGGWLLETIPGLKQIL